jgi:hypothetical protein
MTTPAARSALAPQPYLFGATLLVALVAVLLVACGDGGSDALLGAPGHAALTADGGGDAGALPLTLPDGAPLTEAGILQSQAETMFHALQAPLVSACGGTGGACHVSGAYQNGQTPVWLASPDPYDSIRKYPGIIVTDPYSSKLMIKGPHEGPDFSGPNKALGDQVLAWLTKEALAIKAVPLPSSAPVAVAEGPVVVDLSSAGTGVAGAKMSFHVSITGSILALTDIQVQAPVGAGLHIVHPLFDLLPTSGSDQPDPVDSLSNVDQTVAPATSVTLGTGRLILEGFDATMKLRVEVTKLEPIAPAGGGGDGGAVGPGGGCKDVAGFTANAVPAIQANQCLNCHGSPGGSGYGSLDLTQVGVNDTAACAQALTRVNLANKPQSDILLAPTGGVAAHPFQQADANFKTMMLNWINNE